MNKKNYDKYFMDVAVRTAANSYAVKAKVGAVIVKDNRIISIGWNGTPTGFDNCCEEKYVKGPSLYDIGFKTKPEVIHAEVNAIYWCAKSGITTDGATLYTTLSPCINCALAIIQSGIKRVVYKETYWNSDKTGINLLKQLGIVIEQLED